MSRTSLIGSYYDTLARSEPWLAFLNYGYADPSAGDTTSMSLDLQSVCRRLYEETLLPLPDGRRVLEVGCGRGGGAAFVLEQLPETLYLGVDVSRGNLRLCRHRLGPRREAGFVVADAASLPVRNASVDIALSIEAIHHFTDAERFYQEMARVLRPGGHLLIAGLWPAGESAEGSFARHGLELVEGRDITANVVASLDRTGEERRALVESIGSPQHLLPGVMGWAGVPGYGAHTGLSAGSLTYMRYRLIRP